MGSTKYGADSPQSEMDDDDDRGGSRGNAAGNGDKDEKRGTINRVNRACNNCRRMKMRCVGADDPPCKRCRNARLECVMEKPGRSGDGSLGEDRIKSLESQVTAMQSTLTDLVSTLRAGMSNSSPATTTQHQSTSSTSSNFPVDPNLNHPAKASRVSFDIPPYTSPPVQHHQSTPHIHQDRQHHLRHHHPHQPLNLWSQSAASHPLTTSQLSQDIFATQPAGTSYGFPPRLDSFPGQQTFHQQEGSISDQGSTPFARAEPSPFQAAVAQPASTGDAPATSNPQPPVPHSFAWPGIKKDQKYGTAHMSLPPSRASSVEPEDILAPDQIINPLGEMANMAGLVEAAVKRAKEEKFLSSQNSNKRQAESEGGAVEGTPEPGSKKPRIEMHRQARESSGPGPAKGPQDVPLPGGEGGQPEGLDGIITKADKGENVEKVEKVKGKKGKYPRPYVHAYPSAVEAGLLSEEEGMELMQIYYAGSSNFVPCYDPNVDTWESLKSRSPFSITAICMVGARVRDGGGQPSEEQELCRRHAQLIAVGTLFNSVTRVEAVQATILLSSFCENGWLPGGHAVRMAIDMGIDRSFAQLLRTGMGKGKTGEQLEEERRLVVHSRVWFCLYLMEHQMAYGMGRPAILREDESIHQCRRLLEHPLSITSDARLVSTVELTALRAPLHIELTASPDLPISENTLRRLKQANGDFDAWERYWDRMLSERFMKTRGDFFRESLVIQRQYAELFVNSQLLRGIREPTDVINMPEEKRILAIRAMRNAQRCIEICLRGENYRNGLRYAVHYTHVCAAFAASFLIRIARLFPHELNLRQTARDVEELACLLAEVPAGRYARSLRLILRRARRANVIPAASAHPSPSRLAAAALPDISSLSPRHLPGFSTPGNSFGNPAHHQVLSPNSILQVAAAGNLINDSPSSAELFEFDQLFAQETMQRAGLTLGEGDQLPLYLDGQSLGTSQNSTELTNFVGLENFFIPTELDNRLVSPSMGQQTGGGDGNGGGGAGGNADGNGGGAGPTGGLTLDALGGLVGIDNVWW